METKANHLLVGSFVLILFLGALAFVIWLAKLQVEGGIDRYQMIFTDSVTGLSVGSAVRFSGVRVGEVTEIRLDQESPDQVIVTIEVQSGTPVKSDTVASLELEGLAGGRYLLLSGGSKNGAPPAQVAGLRYPAIETRASALEQVLQGAPDVIEQVNSLLTRGNQLLNDDNLLAVSRTLSSLESFTTTFSQRSEELGLLVPKAEKTLDNLERLSGALAERSEEIDGLIVDGGTVVSNMAELTTTFTARSAEIDQMILDGGKTLSNIEQVTASLAERSDDIDKMISDGGQAVADVRQMTGNLAARGGDIDQLITRSGQTVANLERFSATVAARTEEVDRMISGGSRTVANLEQLTATFAARSQDIDKLITDGGRTLENVQRFTEIFANREEEIDGLIVSASSALANLENAAITASDTAVSLQANAGKLVNRADETLMVVQGVAGNADLTLRQLREDMDLLAADGRLAAQSFANLAETMSEVVEENREPLRDFTAGGLYELANVLSEMRRLIVRLNRVTTQVERDPAQFLFGDPQQGYEANDR